MIWFLRDEGVDHRYGPKFDTRGGVGSNVEGGREAWMGIARSPLPQNYGNLLDNIY